MCGFDAGVFFSQGEKRGAPIGVLGGCRLSQPPISEPICSCLATDDAYLCRRVANNLLTAMSIAGTKSFLWADCNRSSGLNLSFADHLGGGGVPPMLKGTARTLKITPESKYLCICFAWLLSFADHLGGGGVPPMLKGTVRTLKITPESKYLCICFAWLCDVSAARLNQQAASQIIKH
jgi:hypothetical protein